MIHRALRYHEGYLYAAFMGGSLAYRSDFCQRRATSTAEVSLVMMMNREAATQSWNASLCAPAGRAIAAFTDGARSLHFFSTSYRASALWI